MAKRTRITDFTQGPEGKQIFFFALPIIVGSIFMQLYSYIDSVIVGRYLGKEALAAVGASTPIVFMVISMVIGIGIGTTIIISQYYGTRQYKYVRLAANSLYVFLFFAATLMSVLGIVFCENIMHLIQLPEEIIPFAVDYLQVYLGGLIFLFGFNSLSAILRGVGDSKTPLYFLILSALLNIALDLVFIAKLGWGIKGAAWATVLSEACAFIFAVWYVNVHDPVLRFNFLNLKFNRKIFWQCLKLGLPAGLQQTFFSIGMVAVIGIINTFGTDVIAAYSGASRIDALVSVIPMNFGLALTSFVGQNISSGRFDRVHRGLKATLKMSIIACFVLCTLLILFGRDLMGMFLDEGSADAAIVDIGYRYLVIVGTTYWIFAVTFTYSGAIRGAGDTLVPMIITLLSLWLIRIPLAYLFARWWGYLGIWLSVPTSWITGVIPTILYYRSGRWKKKILTGKPVPKNFATFEA